MILEQLVTETITILNDKMGVASERGTSTNNAAVSNLIGDIFRDALL
jgi:hypothetical protein